MNRPVRLPWIEQVALPYEGDACLLWPFSTRGGSGQPGEVYPALAVGYAHVLLCELAHGPRPTPDHEAEHLCGHKLCMNKRHLAWALHVDNCARRTEHGTQTIGERHPGHILTENDVLAIRAVPKVYGSGVALAEQFGVSTATVSYVRSRRGWKHLNEEHWNA